MSDNDGGLAFPVAQQFDERTGTYVTYGSDGMTLRDYFAAKTVQSVIGHLAGDGLLREECPGDFVLYAKTAYMLADAMLEARKLP